VDAALLVSLTSFGKILAIVSLPYVVVIEQAPREEGTSSRCAAPDAFAKADPQVVDAALRALKVSGLPA